MKKLLLLLLFFGLSDFVNAQKIRLEYFGTDTIGYVTGHEKNPIIRFTPLFQKLGIAPPPPSFTVTTLQFSRAGAINMVLMGDGYASGEQAQFLTDCAAFVTAFHNCPPYGNNSTSPTSYQAYWNIYAIQVISTASGATHPGFDNLPYRAQDCLSANPLVPNTGTIANYFSSTFDYGSIHRLIYATNTTAIRDVLTNNLPAYNAVIILCNTPYYGGSGGTYAEYAGGNVSAKEIALHEMGHSFAGLGDEYGGYTGCGSGTELPNVTKETNPSLIKWRAWFTGLPIPTPGGTNCGSLPHFNVGLYAGANYSNDCWYRPSCNCKMSTLGIPFCSVCIEQIIFSMYAKINPIISFTPALTATTTSSFTTSTDAISTLSKIWRVDGTIVKYGDNYTPEMSGIHTVTFTVFDSTTLCKRTLPSFVNTWANINLQGTTPPVCTVPVQSPETNVTTTSATLNWQAVSPAINYNYQVLLGATVIKDVTTTFTTAVISGLTAATGYTWKIKAICQAGESAFSSPQSFTTATPPCNTPTGLNATNITQTTATMNWTAVSGAVSYKVKIGTDTVPVVLNKYDTTGLAANTSYSYSVQSVCDLSSSSFSSPASFMTPDVPPSTITVSAVITKPLCTTGSINLTVGGGTAPYTYRWSNSKTTKDITGLNAGTYIVTVTDQVGGTVSQSYGVVMGLPTPPASFAVSAKTSTTITIAWTKTGCSTSYNARYKLHTDASYTHSINTTSLNHKYTKLQPNTAYDFEVRASVKYNGATYYSHYTFLLNQSTSP